MSEVLDTISRGLQEEHQRLTGMREPLTADLHDAERKLKRVQSALKTLAAKPVNRVSPKPTEQSASKAQVITLLAHLLREKGVMPVEQLRTRIEQQVVASGMSRKGLALRIKEALQLLNLPHLKTAFGFPMSIINSP